MDANETACLSLLREGDRDRYLCALLAPENHRGAIVSLYAFNLEIARIRDLVNEPMAGEIRMQWWRDLLAGGRREESTGHPVSAALLQAIDRYGLPVQSLLNLIDARQFDLYDDPMPDRNTYEGYAGETASALIQLSALVLDPENAPSSGVAAGHAGVAQMTAGCLLLMHRHRARGQIYVPAEILKASGLDREGFLTARDRRAAAGVVDAVCALGREHLGKARLHGEEVARSCFAAFLPVSVADMVFDRAERSTADVLDTPPLPAQWRRQIRYWTAARNCRF